MRTALKFIFLGLIITMSAHAQSLIQNRFGRNTTSLNGK